MFRLGAACRSLLRRKSQSACRRSFCTGTGFDFLGLSLELFGKLHEFLSRRIIPRQFFRQPQTGFGFIPEIYRVHRCIPVRTLRSRLMLCNVSGQARVSP
jgi:hypothetical protein